MKRHHVPNALTVEATLHNSSGTIVLYSQPSALPREASLDKWTMSVAVSPLFWVGQATNKDTVGATMSSHTVGQLKTSILLTSVKALMVGEQICLETLVVKAKAKLADAEVHMTEAKKRKTGKAPQ